MRPGHDTHRLVPGPADKIDLNTLGFSQPLGVFLTHLETVRGNSIRTRNNRLAAIHSPLPLPSLKTKRVTPHVLRHTNAMLLRANDVDISTIALWLGHESIKTTQIYQHADPALKERAIASIRLRGTKPGRYRPTDKLLAFLEGL